MNRLHRALLVIDRMLPELLIVLGMLVDYLAANTAWVAYLGHWGGLATTAIGALSLLLRYARNKALTAPASTEN